MAAATSSPIADLGAAIAATAERVGPSVVGVGRGWGVGSGVVVADGRVLVPAHSLRSREPSLTFADGRHETATIVTHDADLDLAALTVDTGDAPAIDWPDDDGRPAVTIGTPVIALANPGGRGLRATLGFVSTATRRFRGPRGRRVPAGIEHTAPLPRGSAGGPLVDLDGRLLGLNAVRRDGGLILALPVDGGLRARVDAMFSGTAPTRPKLGIAIAPPHVARKLRRAVGLEERDGVLVRAVEDDSPADGAGIARGDLVVAVGGQALDSVDVLYDALDAVAAGGTLELTVVRGDDERPVTVSFGTTAGTEV
jgi:serine protease Do